MTHPAALRCLRLAVLLGARCLLLVVAGRRRGRGLFTGFPSRTIRAEAIGPPRFLGGPSARVPRSPTPARPRPLAMRGFGVAFPLLAPGRLSHLFAIGAQSRGPRPPCVRFAGKVALYPRNTRFRRVANPYRAGLSPAGSLRRFHVRLVSSFPRLRLAHTHNENASPTFHVYEVAKELARASRQLIERIERRDRSLADQARRAAQSMMLNIREGNRRAGRDRAHSFRIGAGSADELVGALDVAEVMGYLVAADLAVPLVLADRVLAMLYRLANPRR
jgi:four helix bundle protein